MTFQIVGLQEFIHDLCEPRALNRCRLKFMVLNLSHKAVVTDINLLVCWLHLLSLSLLLLQVHEGVKYDSEDKVHDEEVAYNHYC